MSVVAKCHCTSLDVQGPNSVPTDNSQDQMIQLTPVAFGLDLRLLGMRLSSPWRDWATPVELGTFLLKLGSQRGTRRARLYCTLHQMGDFKASSEILSPNCNHGLWNPWGNCSSGKKRITFLRLNKLNIIIDITHKTTHMALYTIFASFFM